MLRKKNYLLGLFTLVLLSLLLRFWAYQQTEFANGWDSYFYLIQLKAWNTEGQMHSSDLSLIYPLMLGVFQVVSDYELAFKACAALLAALFTWVTAIAVSKWSGKKQLGFLAGAFTVFSSHLTYFAGQYPKNLLGLVLFLLFAAYIPLFTKKATTKKDWIVCLSLLLLNIVGHRMTAVLSVCFLGLSLVLTKAHWKWIVGLGLGFVALLGIGLVLPGVLSVADWSRFAGFLTVHPQWAPYSFWQSFGWEKLSLLWWMEVMSLGVLGGAQLAWGIIHIQKTEHRIVLGWGVLGMCLIFPFFKWSLDGIGYRFFLAFVLLSPIGLWLWVDAYLKQRWPKWLWGIVIAFILLSGASMNSYRSALHDPPYKLYQVLTKRTFNYVSKEKLELVIAHKSLAEYFTFYSGVDALPWIPEYDIEKEKLWRIATDVNINALKYYLPDGEVYGISPAYVLIREHDWQQYLHLLKEEGRKEELSHINTWRNPHRIRPFYLLKNKRSE